MPERVELPGCDRLAAEHVTLVAEPVDHAPGGQLSAIQVGVRLVVGAADQLHPAGAQQPAQLQAQQHPAMPSTDTETLHQWREALVGRGRTTGGGQSERRTEVRSGAEVATV